MIIRPIEVRDAETFLELGKRVEDSGFMLFEPGEKTRTVDEQRRIIERIIPDKKSTILVAEEENTLIGYLQAMGSNIKRIRHSAHLALGVVEQYRGKGIGTQLFEELFKWAKETEISRLELTVIKHNFKAFNLYRNMGFVLEGEKVNSLIINGEPVNEYYLYKLL